MTRQSINLPIIRVSSFHWGVLMFISLLKASFSCREALKYRTCHTTLILSPIRVRLVSFFTRIHRKSSTFFYEPSINLFFLVSRAAFSNGMKMCISSKFIEFPLIDS